MPGQRLLVQEAAMKFQRRWNVDFSKREKNCSINYSGSSYSLSCC
ncbi:MAG: hypothetical protein WCA84_06040 [Ignavibacteriaceae bacterium]